MLLAAKIKQDGKVYENGSRQIIESIDDGKIRFQSGLVLSKEDGRVRQGDVVTTYKSQGASKLDLNRFEDNQSLRAMADQEDLHVGFTRHRATAKMLVESIEVLREIASRSRRDLPTAVKLVPSVQDRIAFIERMKQIYLRQARSSSDRISVPQKVSRQREVKRKVSFEK